MVKLSLATAEKLIKASEKEARDNDLSMVITIVDDGGNMIAQHRMDDAWIASIDISKNKAWTSVALKMPTSNLEDESVPNGSLYGINTTNDGKIVVFGGGIPLVSEGKVVGAVGVSGDTVPNDVKIAEAAVNAFESQ